MTKNTQTNKIGGANIRTNQYSGRGVDHSEKGGRGGRGGRWNNSRSSGQNNGGGRGRRNQHDLTKKSSHNGAIQSGCLKGLTISSDGNRSTQYKILKDALPVYCAEKLYPGVGEIVRNMEDWKEDTFYPTPPDDATKKKFSTPYCVKLCVKSVVVVTGQDTNGDDITRIDQVDCMGIKWVVFDKNLQKIELGRYEQNVREKEKQ